MNYSKEAICDILKSKIKNLYVHYAEFDKDVDQRTILFHIKKFKVKVLEQKLILTMVLMS